MALHMQWDRKSTCTSGTSFLSNRCVRAGRVKAVWATLVLNVMHVYFGWIAGYISSINEWMAPRVSYSRCCSVPSLDSYSNVAHML